MEYKVLKNNQVEFKHLGITHVRSYNPVLNENGKVNKKETDIRLEELANGVTKKIELGVITNQDVVNGSANDKN